MKNRVLSISGETWHAATMDGLKEMARDHWARVRPKMYHRLTKSGVLEDLLDKAVQFTREDMKILQKQLIEKGYSEDKARQAAWETLQNRWILLPEEK